MIPGAEVLRDTAPAFGWPSRRHRGRLYREKPWQNLLYTTRYDTSKIR